MLSKLFKAQLTINYLNGLEQVTTKMAYSPEYVVAINEIEARKVFLTEKRKYMSDLLDEEYVFEGFEGSSNFNVEITLISNVILA